MEMSSFTEKDTEFGNSHKLYNKKISHDIPSLKAHLDVYKRQVCKLPDLLST